jgi:hypothetical protein
MEIDTFTGETRTRTNLDDVCGRALVIHPHAPTVLAVRAQAYARIAEDLGFDGQDAAAREAKRRRARALDRAPHTEPHQEHSDRALDARQPEQ